MNVEALKVLRKNPEEIEELTQLMYEALSRLERRLAHTLNAMASPEEVA